MKKKNTSSFAAITTLLHKGLVLVGVSMIGLTAHHVEAKSSRPYVYQMPIPDGYKQIGTEMKVPSSILYSIAMQESNALTNKNRFMPWPWTANIYGVGYRFNSREDLYKFAQMKIKRGITLIDIGAGQVNWKYHKKRFNNDLWAATDPAINLKTSAIILRDLYQEEQANHGSKANWWVVVGKYHSPANGWRAQQYRTMVYKKWKKVVSQESDSMLTVER